MSNVFHRTTSPLIAVSASQWMVRDSEGREYLDAAGGAIVANVGHGDPEVVAALQSASQLDYVHPSVFTSESLEEYATALAPHLPVDRPRVYPTSGGAESVETALKMARAYHLANDEPERDVVIARRQSYHGNTLGALDASGRKPLRSPYLPWLGRTVHIPEVNEYRCPSPGHPEGCAAWHAAQLEDAILTAGEGRAAVFIAEAIGGAAVGVARPPDGYWGLVTEVCKRHGVLLIVDEVMTGFGRTGTWFGIDHYEARPDIIVSGKGAAGGYWPLGLCVSSGDIHDTLAGSGGFTHGFTFSHSPVGASVARAVLRRLESSDLVEASASLGRILLDGLTSALAGSEIVGRVEGIGLLVGVELVADVRSRSPFSRSEGVVERVTAAARERGLLVYPSIGCADGTDGDAILLGPPFTIGEPEVEMIVDRLTQAIGAVSR